MGSATTPPPGVAGALPAGTHVAFLSWRDTANPEGGGAERYLEKMTVGLVERGCTVTVFCAAHDEAPADEVVDGVRYVRRGSKMSVYPHGMRALRSGLLDGPHGSPDVVVDVQNGLPFLSRLVTDAPVVVLCHHVHREQWPVVYPGPTGRVGWWVERRLAPRLYRRDQYVAVSSATKAELVALGVDAERIAVVHNGTDPYVAVEPGKAERPLLTVVGRLVPHKQVEHAIDAAVSLAADHPGLRLHVVGSGWWAEELHAHAARVDPEGRVVVFDGQVDEDRKHALYELAWVQLLPSLKEGWGLVIGEAGMHATPTLAYRAAGGTQESIEDGFSGLLLDPPEELTAALRRVLDDEDLRLRLSRGALEVSHRFTWTQAQHSFAEVLRLAISGSRTSAADPGRVGVRAVSRPGSRTGSRPGMRRGLRRQPRG